jgi:hypothetical protein
VGAVVGADGGEHPLHVGLHRPVGDAESEGDGGVVGSVAGEFADDGALPGGDDHNPGFGEGVGHGSSTGLGAIRSQRVHRTRCRPIRSIWCPISQHQRRIRSGAVPPRCAPVMTCPRAGGGRASACRRSRRACSPGTAGHPPDGGVGGPDDGEPQSGPDAVGQQGQADAGAGGLSAAGLRADGHVARPVRLVSACGGFDGRAVAAADGAVPVPAAAGVVVAPRPSSGGRGGVRRMGSVITCPSGRAASRVRP